MCYSITCVFLMQLCYFLCRVFCIFDEVLGVAIDIPDEADEFSGDCNGGFVVMFAFVA